MKHPIADREVAPAPARALPPGWWPAGAEARRARYGLTAAARYRAYALPFLYAGSAIWNGAVLWRLWNAPREGLLGQTLQARPEIWRMLRVRFVSARWATGERLDRIAGHCDLAERMGGPFAVRPHQRAILMRLDDVASGTQVVIDSPRWLLREGLLAMSLFHRGDRIFSLSFTLAEEKGVRVAFVGGIQGRRAADALERNRLLTRGAAGARPQDLLVELFRALCSAVGITRILCVSDCIRNGRTPFAHGGGPDADPVTFDYDTLWRERGGVLRPDGFFDLPVYPEARDDSELTAKKRAARRKKLAMIASLQDRLVLAMSRPRQIRIEQVEPV